MLVKDVGRLLAIARQASCDIENLAGLLGYIVLREGRFWWEQLRELISCFASSGVVGAIGRRFSAAWVLVPLGA